MKSMMQKVMGLALGLFSLAVLAAPALRAETRVDGTTVAVSITIAPNADPLVTQVKNVSNDLNAANVTFPSFSGPQSSWNLVASQYVQVTVDNNALSWRLRLYSNNFPASQPSTTTWGFQYGGLVAPATPGAKIPMAWLVNPNTILGGPGIGSPANPANSAINGWTFLKDARDVDDPNTPIVGTTGNESFTAADGAGFTNIAFGSPSFTRIVRPNVGGSEALPTINSPFFLYFKGDVSGASAASYNTNLVMDLFNL